MSKFSATFDLDTVSHLGYHQAKDPNGYDINYWYQFWGGVFTVSKRGDGDSKILVSFLGSTDFRYKVKTVVFYRELAKKTVINSGPHCQFDSTPADDNRSVTIFDRITTYGHLGDVFFNILVADTAAKDPNLTIVCDPTIHNVGIDNVP